MSLSIPARWKHILKQVAQLHGHSLWYSLNRERRLRARSLLRYSSPPQEEEEDADCPDESEDESPPPAKRAKISEEVEEGEEEAKEGTVRVQNIIIVTKMLLVIIGFIEGI